MQFFLAQFERFAKGESLLNVVDKKLSLIHISFPPLTLVTARYLLSGSIMLLFARARGLYLPRGRELAAACVSGFLTLGIGNGALVFAEVLVPSGIALSLIHI